MQDPLRNIRAVGRQNGQSSHDEGRTSGLESSGSGPWKERDRRAGPRPEPFTVRGAIRLFPHRLPPWRTADIGCPLDGLSRIPHPGESAKSTR